MIDHLNALNEDLDFKQNPVVNKFYLELNDIKKSMPEKKTIFERVPDNSSFFNSLFGVKKVIEKTIYEDIYIEGFLSISQFFKLLYDYFDYVYFKSQEFIRTFENKNGYKKDLYMQIKNCYDCLCIRSKHSKSKYDYYSTGKEVLRIDFERFPDLKNGSRQEYETVKDDIFKLIPVIKNYCNIFRQLKRKIYISDSVFIEVLIQEENDIFDRIYPIFKFKISDIAMIEVSKNNGEDEKYLSYADDKQLAEILEESSEELFYSCYLSKDIDLIKLLENK